MGSGSSTSKGAATAQQSTSADAKPVPSAEKYSVEETPAQTPLTAESKSAPVQTTSAADSKDIATATQVVETMKKSNKIASIDADAPFSVGDFVEYKVGDEPPLEGIIVEIIDDSTITVEFGGAGETTKDVPSALCKAIVKSDELEVGDQVQIQPEGSYMTFVGRISEINPDGTYDVQMKGDDPDDVEKGAQKQNITKLMSRRALVIARWKRAAMVVSSIHKFQSFSQSTADENDEGFGIFEEEF
mmetsp:Transcript_21911/g.36684  ORF Transcript_21911/g.36684 Transcript_21911/m.36684 type:complete len:245 (+) Transcript_21911:189-923(+)